LTNRLNFVLLNAKKDRTMFVMTCVNGKHPIMIICRFFFFTILFRIMKDKVYVLQVTNYLVDNISSLFIKSVYMKINMDRLYFVSI